MWIDGACTVSAVTVKTLCSPYKFCTRVLTHVYMRVDADVYTGLPTAAKNAAKGLAVDKEQKKKMARERAAERGFFFRSMPTAGAEGCDGSEGSV